MNQTIYELELSLLTPTVRQSKAKLNNLLADNFLEFGSSGKIYNKEYQLNSLPSEEQKKFFVEDFTTIELMPQVILATYKVTINTQKSLRSSLWKFNGKNWQMIFHQGTNVIG
ncbi:MULTISPECIES: DUF4440 domain-containing protein [Legionella]|uniref:DUF4440 domain-containing protein n=1 Tax=Legionella drozanskii LLAP-1 TaxID=1212489 RepID=A0A0W0SM78_9GAMM|nr:MULTISPECIES: DUF4440 domain-containing protein [Legionella]KTC84369.1 hypothetical protein Ldro_2972 [Legionella drozanskii LLAP-1]PJE06702.1 MAG: DUF4440 domain-containing protein [Legionella sp.]